MKLDFTKFNDDKLIDLIKSHSNESEKAFEEIYERYAARLYAYCRRAQNEKELAEDIFQETFYRFYKSIINKPQDKGKVKKETELANQELFVTDKKYSIMGFLITIARNLCINRQKQIIPNVSINELTSIDELNFIQFSENGSNLDELSELAIMALDFLEPDNKEVIILRYYVNMEYSEIAEIFSTTANAVRVKVHRAKSKIKAIIADYENKL